MPVMADKRCTTAVSKKPSELVLWGHTTMHKSFTKHFNIQKEAIAEPLLATCFREARVTLLEWTLSPDIPTPSQVGLFQPQMPHSATILPR